MCAVDLLIAFSNNFPAFGIQRAIFKCLMLKATNSMALLYDRCLYLAERRSGRGFVRIGELGQLFVIYAIASTDLHSIDRIPQKKTPLGALHSIVIRRQWRNIRRILRKQARQALHKSTRFLYFFYVKLLADVHSMHLFTLIRTYFCHSAGCNIKFKYCRCHAIGS